LYFRWKQYIKCHWRDCLQLPLVVFLCCSLVMMGTLFWIDNSWALILDNDPLTVAEISDYFDGNPGLQDDDDGVVPIAGGILIRGNGDQDDNKEEIFQLDRRFEWVVYFKMYTALNSFVERHITRSYKDFGHLKVMPAGGDIAGFISISLLT